MSNYKSNLQTNNLALSSNNADLQSLIEQANSLPDATDGVELPTLTNEGSSADLLSNKQLIDQNGNIVTGTMPDNGSVSQSFDGINVTSVTIPEGYTSGGTIGLDNTISDEANAQSSLIDAIIAKANSLPEVGSGEAAIPTQEKTVNIISNGTVEVFPDNGYTLSKVTANVAVSGEGSSGGSLDGRLDGSLTEINSNVTSLITRACQAVTSLETVNLPNVTNIGTYAFHSCESLVNFNAPNLTTAGTFWLYGTAIQELYMPKLTSIAGTSFQNCTSLVKADFHATKSVSANAFNGCSSLTALILRYTASSVCSLANVNALTGTPIANGTGYIYVPSSKLAAYQSATNWTNFSSQFRAIESYPDICG